MHNTLKETDEKVALNLFFSLVTINIFIYSFIYTFICLFVCSFVCFILGRANCKKRYLF